MMIRTEKDKTVNFRKKYLVPGETGKGYGFYSMMYESRGVNKGMIGGLIRSMLYEDYLHTRYWKLVSLQVKHDAGWKCERCGGKWGLVVHHRDYRLLGYDMFHLDSLQCLCRECHEKLHGIRQVSK